MNNIPKGYQILFKTIVVGTHLRMQSLQEWVGCDKGTTSMEFITEPENEHDKNAIAVYGKGIKTTFFFFKNEVFNKIGYIKKDVAKILNENDLFNHLIYRPSNISVTEKYINIYFDILIEKSKMKELKANESFMANYEKDMTNVI